MSGSLETILNLGVALTLGLLVGLERGWQERSAAEGRRVAGIRTFALIALLGGLAEILARAAGEILLGIAFFALVVLMAISHAAEARESKDYGVTTLIAALITFVLGAMAVRGEQVIAAAGAVVTTIVLSLKPVLHQWLQRIAPEELAAALKLLLISVVILPILPDRAYGPWQAINPYRLWWIVVVLAAISFAAYAAVKTAGAEWGILLTGFLGGMVSSTGVSIHLARLARTLSQEEILIAGVLVASATMFLRVLVLVAVLNFELFAGLWIPMLAMAVVLAGAAAVYDRRSKRTRIDSFQLRNPVELGQALQFGLLLAVILLATQAARAWLGEAGLFLVAGVSGIADVDAITISLARVTGGEMAARSVSLAVFVATLVNTLTKTTLVAVLGGPKIGAKIAWPMVGSLALGTALIWILK